MKINELIKNMEQGKRPLCLWLYGEERYFIHQVLMTATKGIEEIDREHFDQSSTPNEWVSSSWMPPWMSPYRLVIVQLTQMTGIGKADLTALEVYCKKPNPQTLLVVTSPGTPDKRLKIFKLLQPFAQACEPVTPIEAGHFVSNRMNGLIDKAVAAALVERVGTDLWTLHHEADKLLSYTDGKSVSYKDILDLTIPNINYKIYEIVDAVADGRGGQAQRLVLHALQQKEEPLYMLGAFSRHYHQLMSIKQYMALKKPAGQMAAELGMKDFFIGRMQAQAKKISAGTIRQGLSTLLQAENDIKTGKKSKPDQVLQQAVAQLLCGGGT